MQDQLNGNATSNLQQQQGNLQQSTPNLQQSGTPTSTANVSGFLSEAPPSGQLQVSTAATSNSTSIQPDVVSAKHGSGAWLLLVLFVLIIAASYVVYFLWPRRIQELAAEVAEEPIEPEPVTTPQPKKPKTKKKSKNRKKSGRR